MDPQSLISASETGQKEVLDASVIGSLLKANGDKSIIEPELPALRQTPDCLGRSLFRFWHCEKTPDCFGNADMPLRQVEHAELHEAAPPVRAPVCRTARRPALPHEAEPGR
jgi:hypothetical protein